jgi:integrase
MSSKGQVNPHSKSKNAPKNKPPSRSTLHNEIVTLRLVLKNAVRHGKLSHVPDLSPPYRTQGKIEHRPWFSPEEYKQLYTATRAYAKEPFHDSYKWNAEQLHDYVLFMANTGLRPDEAKNLQHRDVEIVDDRGSGETILEITVRGKRGKGFCKSMPAAVRPYERLLARAKPLETETRRQAQRRRKEGGALPPAPVQVLPQPTDPVFPGSNVKIFNNLLIKEGLKIDRDGKNRTAYSLRHTYICMRLSEGANIYDIARNCRTSVEMIQKFYAAHIKDLLDASSINVMRPKATAGKAKTATAPVDELEDA